MTRKEKRKEGKGKDEVAASQNIVAVVILPVHNMYRIVLFPPSIAGYVQILVFLAKYAVLLHT